MAARPRRRATGSARGSTPPSRRCPTPPPTPTMVVDLDAFDANAADLVRRAGGTPIRVASKSLRVPALIARALARRRLLRACWRYTLREALWLHEQGISDDIVLGYPTVDRGALGRLVASPSARGRDHADGRRRRAPRRRRLGPLLHGRRRSGSRSTSTPGCGWAASTSARSARRCTTPPTSCALARDDRRPARLPAGRRDDLRGPGRRRAGRRADPAGAVADRAPAQVRLDRASWRYAAARSPTRCAEVADLEFWNAGGSGSVESTGRRPGGHRGRGRLRAAGARRCSTTTSPSSRGRRRTSGVPVAAPAHRRHGHRRTAAASSPPARTAPTGCRCPWAPAGPAPDRARGRRRGADPAHRAGRGHLLQIGDLVWFRHAKSGELFEHAQRRAPAGRGRDRRHRADATAAPGTPSDEPPMRPDATVAACWRTRRPAAAARRGPAGLRRRSRRAPARPPWPAAVAERRAGARVRAHGRPLRGLGRARRRAGPAPRRRSSRRWPPGRPGSTGATTGTRGEFAELHAVEPSDLLVLEGVGSGSRELAAYLRHRAGLGRRADADLRLRARAGARRRGRSRRTGCGGWTTSRRTSPRTAPRERADLRRRRPAAS